MTASTADPVAAPASPPAGAVAAGATAPGTATVPGRPWYKRTRLLLIIGAATLLVALIGLLTWLYLRQFESTDDAFVDARIVRIAPQVAGRVLAVLVDDNAFVKLGQPLIVIDSAGARTRVSQLKAQRAQALAELGHTRAQTAVAAATLEGSRSDVAAAAAQALVAALDLARYEHLLRLNPQAVAPQQLDDARAAVTRTAAQQAAAVSTTKVRSAEVVAGQALVQAGEAQILAIEAQMEAAELDLGYARLNAPQRGHIAQLGVAVGDYVAPGNQILAIVPERLWVTANFKETQLDRMRPGQAVTVTADACPGLSLRGHVDSLQRGAGQAFAILPAENATGNFVKVVQRVPVKILLDTLPAPCVLGPGMSVEPRVRVR